MPGIPNTTSTPSLTSDCYERLRQGFAPAHLDHVPLLRLGGVLGTPSPAYDTQLGRRKVMRSGSFGTVPDEEAYPESANA